MNFSEIIGHKNIVDSLKKSLNRGDIAHAYIFEGPSGIGKKTTAKVFASAILCEEENKPCGSCKPCLLFNTNAHPDLKVVTPDSSVSVDEIRNIVRDVNIRPYYGGRKVYIIAADKMTIQAQNSLLKTLEEPPEYAVIILTAQSIGMLLPTIVSRGIIKKFHKNSAAEIEQYIIKKYPEHKERAKVVSTLSDGIIGSVKQIIESESFNKAREKTLQIIKRMSYGNKNEMFDSIKFFTDNKDDVDLVLHLMLLWFRDILILKETGNASLVINTDAVDILSQIAQSINSDKSVRWVDIVVDAMQKLKSNTNFQLTIEVMLLKLSE